MAYDWERFFEQGTMNITSYTYTLTLIFTMEHGLYKQDMATHEKINLRADELLLFISSHIQAKNIESVCDVSFAQIKKLEESKAKLLIGVELYKEKSLQQECFSLFTFQDWELDIKFHNMLSDYHNARSVQGLINPFTITKYLYSLKTGKEFLPPSLIKFLGDIESRQKEELAQPQVQRTKRARQEVSQELFARMCGVSKKTIQNWDKGNAPQGYCGRESLAICKQYAETYKLQRAVRREGRRLNKASTGQNIDNYSQGYYDN